MPKVWWAALLERNTQEYAVSSLLDVAAVAGYMRYTRIRWPYSRTDVARNSIAKLFLEYSNEPDDVLVMLDNDHILPSNVITRLVENNKGVCAALAFRRSPPHYPCMFVKDKSGYSVVSEYERGLVECTHVGTGAIAIRRSVFEKLNRAHHRGTFFKYKYDVPGMYPSEDIYFGDICQAVGISHWCDTTFEIPHLNMMSVTEETWQEELATRDATGVPMDFEQAPVREMVNA